jgi:hypothetical protein
VWPLPNGRILVGDNVIGGQDVLLATTDGSEPPRVPESVGVQPAFVPPDLLLTVRGLQLLAWPFDLVAGKITGEPVTVRSGVQPRGIGGRLYSVSQTGVLAVRNDVGVGQTRVAWFDREGREGSTLKLDRRRHARAPGQRSVRRDRAAVRSRWQVHLVQL